MLVVITAGSVTASSLDNYTSNFKFNTVSTLPSFGGASLSYKPSAS